MIKKSSILLTIVVLVATYLSARQRAKVGVDEKQVAHALDPEPPFRLVLQQHGHARQRALRRAHERETVPPLSLAIDLLEAQAHQPLVATAAIPGRGDPFGRGSRTSKSEELKVKRSDRPESSRRDGPEAAATASSIRSDSANRRPSQTSPGTRASRTRGGSGAGPALSVCSSPRSR